MGERGTATVGTIPFGREVVENAAALCDAQIERLGEGVAPSLSR